MAEAVVTFAVERLGDLLIQEAILLSGVNDEVQGIQIELRRMQCFLKDADSRMNEDESVRNWVSEIRDLAYDAEDVIESFAVKVASKRRGGFINVLKRFVCIVEEGLESHKIGCRIQDLTAKISNLTRSLETYGVRDMKNSETSSSAYQRQRQLRWSYSHVAEKHIIRREEINIQLVKHLVESKNSCQVVSIWGMGGLGKTTLAKEIYHYSQVRSNFDCFAWSCISQKCQPRDVWEGILIKLISPSLEQRDEILKLRDEEVAQKLYQIQQERKCLVVLDDIWSIQDWDRLKAAFPVQEMDSKILLTSRKREVALHVDPTGFLCEPQCLSGEESWDLLQRIAIPLKDRTDLINITRMEELGKKMVEHCAGLPLAVTVLGGLLATKYTAHEWQIVHDNIKSYMRRGKIHGQEQFGVLDVLALSYDDLPARLKPCFLNLGNFPEDYEIPVVKLIRMWMAEGFIPLVQLEDDGEESMEEVAERHLHELVERCMIQVGETDSNSKMRTCRMHDLMRDLCLQKAKQENFLDIINYSHNNEISPSSLVRRLAVHLNRDRRETDLRNSIRNHHTLRSLLYFYDSGNGYWQRFWKLSAATFDSLKLLRVLDLEGVNINGGKLPKDIGNLIHLRFLSLRNSKVLHLPPSIGNLRRLQTLDLYTGGRYMYVPNEIFNLEQLRHLYLPSNHSTGTGFQLASLRHLRTIVNLRVNNYDMNNLANMINVRELGIRVSSDGFTSIETFKLPNGSLKYLQSLSIIDDYSDGKLDIGLFLSSFVNIHELKLDMGLKKIPDYQEFPPNISHLCLQNCLLAEDPMPTLGKLPNLKVLQICENVFIGEEMICSKEDFPLLHTLLVEGQPKFEVWRVDEGAIPNLCRLTISNCWYLKSYPDGLRFAASLRELKIISMPKTFKDKMIEGGEDFYKVQHVPLIEFLHSTSNMDFLVINHKFGEH
ncbi:putative disease resistance protein At1g50180 isoform X2 [Mercurialis annua]|uniref:putative disease resistance protein At1g50180 isoform X2 n=1 Tax=Mercurialis annua TaxID=3986 RepID=UPI0021610AE0|nr:putative disease resistance protein At1g50180 isoform X2 [Mercurialis annua]